jgi:hypothetical protein
LLLISTALDHRDAGTALSQYLTASPRITRTDVQKEPLCVRAGCAPDRIPSGRWVTGTDRPLAFSQQFAVNQILRTLSGTSGLFAVNGPPGTGNTTMLRDVIAAIVVNRAIELALPRLTQRSVYDRPRAVATGAVPAYDHHSQSETDRL